MPRVTIAPEMAMSEASWRHAEKAAGIGDEMIGRHERNRLPAAQVGRIDRTQPDAGCRASSNGLGQDVNVTVAEKRFGLILGSRPDDQNGGFVLNQTLHLWQVSTTMGPLPVMFRNCLGFACLLTGQNRVPDPPAMTTTCMVSSSLCHVR
jgi:hypothetical protein